MGDLDRISGLPDHIISHILSFIPTKEAVRTSVLSPNWRYRFASMSTFDFVQDCKERMPKEIDYSFKMFVDRLLSFPNPLTIDCFRLHNYSWSDDESRIYRWISVVLSRGVKELVLSMFVSPILSSHIFTSHSLVTLIVKPYTVLHIPTNVSLPNLKILRLYRYIVLDDSLFKLISSSNVLEDLKLTKTLRYDLDLKDIIIKNPSLKRLVLNVYNHSHHLVEINTPNLVYLSYDDDLAKLNVLSDMKFLKTAYIRIYVSKERDPPFLQAICNVQSLHMDADPFPVSVLAFNNLVELELSQTVLEFNNLVELELETPCGEWLVKFLHRAPNLKTLTMRHDEDDVFRFIPEKVPSCLSFHLKEITFSASYKNKVMLEIISYFLNHALVLEKLEIRLHRDLSKEDLSILKKLLRLLGISIDELLYSKEEYGIIKKLLRLPGSRTIDVSLVDWCDD